MKKPKVIKTAMENYDLNYLSKVSIGIEGIKETTTKNGLNTLGFTKEDVLELLRLGKSLFEKMKNSPHYQFFKNRLMTFEKGLLELKLSDLKRFWKREILDEINQWVSKNPEYLEEQKSFLKKVEIINGEVPQRDMILTPKFPLRQKKKRSNNSGGGKSIRNSAYKPRPINRQSSFGMTG